MHHDPSLPLTRRDCGLLATALAVSMASPATPRASGATADALAPLNRFPRMMQEFLVAQVRQAHRLSVDAKAVLDTPEQAEDYVRTVRKKIRECFGPEPVKTPLNPRITGVVERDTYRIEKVIFESRPNFPVTANLYLPKSGFNDRGKLPGVVGTCGHSTNGKAAEAYQSFAQGLARKGYVCLIYDPIGQGERLQYVAADLKSKLRPGVAEHIQAGNQQFLVGENLSMWRAWDGIRALDYLLTRPEVDRNQVGITGNSGGGTMTTWLCGVEQRWTMAAPACFVTTFLRNAENELPADTEQCPPRVLALGLEHEDFLAALAPKPIVILAKERDFFDVRGSEEAFKRLKRLYRLLGKPENIRLHTGPTEHGYSIENREAMYAWFNRVVGNGSKTREPEMTIEADATLQCTESGQVHELDPNTVFSFTKQKAEALVEQREQLEGERLRNALRDALKLPPDLPEKPAPFRILRAIGGRDFPLPHFTTYALETEPRAMAVCYQLGNEPHYSRPRRGGTRARLYVSHRSADEELRSDDWVRSLFGDEQDMGWFACDVRGIGESLPNTCGNDTFDNPYGCDYFYAAHGIMLDRPYLGQKTLDVLRVLQWIRAYGFTEIELCSSGWGAYTAVLAATLDPNVVSLRLKTRPTNFHTLATTELDKTPLAYLVPNVLRRFDLPDCYQELGERLLVDNG